LRIASPKRYQPRAKLLKHAGGRVICTEDLQQAARGADVLYTDIWVSMGKEGDEARREAELGPYWINESLVKMAKAGRAGDALFAGASRSGDRRENFRSARADHFRPSREPAARAESDSG